MVIQVRNSVQYPLVEIDIFIKTSGQYKFVEIDTSISVKEYSLFLLAENDKAKQNEMINDFEFFDITIIRHWLNADGFKRPELYDDVVVELEQKNQHICNKYKLDYFSDSEF